MISRSSHQRLMGDTEHLTMARQQAQQIGHRTANTAAHSSIDFIEEQGAGSIHLGQAGLESQQKTRHLPPGSHFSKRCHGLTWIR